MKTLKINGVFLLLIMAFGLCGCGNNSDQDNLNPELNSITNDREKGVIYEHLKIPVTTIDPAYVQNASEIMISKLIFQGLVKENSKGEVVPHIAVKWEISPDKLTYTFHLQKQILFHNEKEIVAGDFKFSWERVLRLNAPTAYLFANIQGAAQVLAGKETLVSGITVLNDYTLQVKLIYPQNNFIKLLTHPAGAVLDRYEVVEQGVDFAKPGSLSEYSLIPSGSGPFLLIEWIEGRSLTLGRNPLYYGEKPQIWRIEFSLTERTEDAILDFLAGRTQIMQDVLPAEFEHLPQDELEIPLVEKPVLQFAYVGINAGIPPFNNKALRDAVMYSLNEAEILKAARGKSGEILTGYVTDYWYHQSVQEKIYDPYDRNTAVNMLSQAGFPGGINLGEIPLYCGSSEEDQIMAKKIKENLGAVGISLKVQQLAQKDLRRVVKNGEAAFYLGKFTPRSTELEDFFREQIDSRWQRSIVNPLWDQLLDNAAQQDQSMRLKLYRQLEREVISDSRIRYLFTYHSSVAVSERLDKIQIGSGNNVLFEELEFKE